MILEPVLGGALIPDASFSSSGIVFNIRVPRRWGNSENDSAPQNLERFFVIFFTEDCNIIK